MFQPELVVSSEPMLFQRDGFTRCKNTHHDVFNAAHGGNSGNPQLDIKWTVLFEFYFPVLRFAFFRDVQITHDFQACDHGLAELRRNFNIRLQGTVVSGGLKARGNGGQARF